jgi:hypothetical protein
MQSKFKVGATTDINIFRHKKSIEPYNYLDGAVYVNNS